MNVFADSITGGFKRSTRSFRTFPATMFAATAFVVVTILQIEINGPDRASTEFLLTCLQWALALGAVFSLAAITFVQTRFNTRSSFVAANLIGLGVVVGAFALLNLLGSGDADGTSLPSLTAARMVVAILVSLLAFISFAGEPPEQSGFARAFFMTQRAFFIALVYGLVIGGGTSAVAAAVQGLLYRNMSDNVYAYIALLAGFMGWAIFVGYFPDFRRGVNDPRRDYVQDQPRFIEILCEYILIPILLAFTVVLLAWVVRILLPGDAPLINILSTSISTYSLVGIWLHIMVTHYETKLASFYRKVFPIALLIVIAFAFVTVLRQINSSGIKENSYWFILIAVFSAGSAILLLIRRNRSHNTIAALAAVLAVITVLPLVGAYDLPIRAQVNRLERLLTEEGMLSNGELQPASDTPDEATRIAITDAVNDLAYSPSDLIPIWLDASLGDPSEFRQRFGFSMTGPFQDPDPYNERYLMLPPASLDISDYDWALEFEERDGEFIPPFAMRTFPVEGERGIYQLEWSVPSQSMPKLKIMLNDEVILEEDLQGYWDGLSRQYPVGTPELTPTVEDMSYRIETEDISVWLLFDSVALNDDQSEDYIGDRLQLRQIYLREN